MLTKEVTDELNHIFQSLNEQGKEPTLALVKARLSTKVPMPALIAAIKNWKNAKPLPKIEVAVETASAEDKIAELEKQLAALTLRVQQLEEERQ